MDSSNQDSTDGRVVMMRCCADIAERPTPEEWAAMYFTGIASEDAKTIISNAGKDYIYSLIRHLSESIK